MTNRLCCSGIDCFVVQFFPCSGMVWNIDTVQGLHILLTHDIWADVPLFIHFRREQNTPDKMHVLAMLLKEPPATSELMKAMSWVQNQNLIFLRRCCYHTVEVNTSASDTGLIQLNVSLPIARTNFTQMPYWCTIRNEPPFQQHQCAPLHGPSHSYLHQFWIYRPREEGQEEREYSNHQKSSSNQKQLKGSDR